MNGYSGFDRGETGLIISGSSHRVILVPCQNLDRRHVVEGAKVDFKTNDKISSNS